MNHTPGPWRIGFSDGSGSGLNSDGEDTDGPWIMAQIGDDPRNAVTVVNGGVDDWGVKIGIKRLEDAKLIALAPEMYAALQAIADAGLPIVLGTNSLSHAMSAKARAVLAKLEG